MMYSCLMIIRKELLEIKALAMQVIDKVDDALLADVHAWGTPIEALGLSPRARNCLVRRGIEYIEQLIKLDIDELMRIRNMGKHTAQEIIEKVNRLGIDWLSISEPK